MTKLIQLKTEGDRTLFFDLLPLAVGEVQGYGLRVRLFTVPGQTYHAATRRLVLRDVDGLVFVGDLDPRRAAENLAALEDLARNLPAVGLTPRTVPVVLQANKADLPDAISLAAFMDSLRLGAEPTRELFLQPDVIRASAITGGGVVATFEAILRQVARVAFRRLDPRHSATASRQVDETIGAALDAWKARTRNLALMAQAPPESFAPATEPKIESLLAASVQRAMDLAESLGDQRFEQAELSRRVRELETIEALSRKLARTHDIQGVGRAVAEAARAALPSGRAALLLIDARGGLREAGLAGLERDPCLSAGGDAALRALIACGESKVMDPPPEDIASAAELEAAGLPRDAVLAFTPVLVNDRPRGLLCVYGDRSDRTDAHEARRFVSAVAAQATLALENAMQRRVIATQHARLEQEVEARTAELRRAHAEIVAMSRIKDRLLDSVNHELRTPVAKLLATAQAIERARETAPPPHLVSGLVGHARHLAKLIDQVTCTQALMSGNRDEHDPPNGQATTDLAQLVQAVVHSCHERAAERRVVIRREAPMADLGGVEGDGGTIALALSPILENAVKFTPAGTEVLVRVVTAPDHRVRILVSDAGPGIRSEDVERVFDEMDQGSGDLLTQKPSGLGLGLAIARRAARRVGGDVGVMLPGQTPGATVCLELRLARAAVTPSG